MRATSRFQSRLATALLTVGIAALSGCVRFHSRPLSLFHKRGGFRVA